MMTRKEMVKVQKFREALSIFVFIVGLIAVLLLWAFVTGYIVLFILKLLGVLSVFSIRDVWLTGVTIVGLGMFLSWITSREEE